MTDTVIELADKFKTALSRNDMAAQRRLITAYKGLWATIKEKVDNLILEISTLEEPTPAQIQRLKRYGILLDDIREELARYSAYTQVELSTAAREAIRLGEGNARLLTAASLGDAALASQLNRINPVAIEKLLGFLTPGGELFKRLDGMPNYTADQVANAILEGVGLGKNPKAIAKAITKTFGMALTDSMRTTRTVQLWAYREANRASYLANSDVVRGWIWYADVAKACPACMAMHGTEHGMDESLDDHFNGGCLVPETLVSGITPDAVVSRHYDGEIISIRTTSGKFLSVTPNHPILTDRGWVAANLLKHGDNVVSYSGGEWAAFGVNPNEYQVPTRVKDIFGSSRMGGFVSVPTSPQDFHGDGKGSNIHIIRSNRLLLDNADPTVNQPRSEQSLGGGYVQPSQLARFGDFSTMDTCMFHAPRGFLRDTDSANQVVVGDLRERENISLVLPSQNDINRLQSRFDSTSADTVTFSQIIDALTRIKPIDNLADRQREFGKRGSGNLFTDDGITGISVSQETFSLEKIRQSLHAGMPTSGANLDALTSHIVFDGITEISVTSFSGHVYNLQTKVEWYIANSIITHNCAALPLVIGAKNDIPSGESVFSQLPEAEQKARLGADKWQAWKDGAFSFEQLATTHTDGVYGDMTTTRSLKDLLGK